MTKESKVIAALTPIIFSSALLVATPAQSAALEPCDTEVCKTHFKKFKKAARRGYLSAQYNTGKFYYFGYGTNIDQEKALYYYRKAAVKGVKEAQYMAGLLFITNDELKDYNQGIKWLERAANFNHVHAAFLLGKVHAIGTGGKANYQKSDKWLSYSFDNKHNKLPAFIETLAESGQFNEANYPILYPKLIKENLWQEQSGKFANWESNNYERITVTGTSQKIAFDNLLAKFRGRNNTSGSRLKGDCTMTAACQRKSLNEMKDSMWVSQK